MAVNQQILVQSRILCSNWIEKSLICKRWSSLDIVSEWVTYFSSNSLDAIKCGFTFLFLLSCGGASGARFNAYLMGIYTYWGRNVPAVFSIISKLLFFIFQIVIRNLSAIPVLLHFYIGFAPQKEAVGAIQALNYRNLFDNLFVANWSRKLFFVSFHYCSDYVFA